LLSKWHRDPEARSDFRFIVTSYTNSTNLFFVGTQRADKQEDATPLLSLWQDATLTVTQQPALVVRELDNLRFNPNHQMDVLRDLAPVFNEFAAKNSGKLRRWMAFQLRTQFHKVFEQGGTSVHQLGDALEVALNHPECSPLWQDLALVRIPKEVEFASQMPSRKPGAFALAYVYWAFCKGTPTP
jgi:hypothetical protein